MILNDDNYFSQESNEHYMSVSQFKQGIEELGGCEARMVAELKDEYKRPYSKALTVGSYLHSYFEGFEAFNKFESDNKDLIFKKNGAKYSEFEQALAMIHTLDNDPFCMYALTGEKEVIYTGELFGVEWKIKIDNINHEKLFFSDIKSTQELRKRYWSDRHKRFVSFIDMYGYDIQMSVYQEIIRQNTGRIYNPFIVAVTKESKPDKAIIHFDEEELKNALEYVSEHIDSVVAAKIGQRDAYRCEKCEYCRQTKKLTTTIGIEDLLK